MTPSGSEEEALVQEIDDGKSSLQCYSVLSTIAQVFSEK